MQVRAGKTGLLFSAAIILGALGIAGCEKPKETVEDRYKAHQRVATEDYTDAERKELYLYRNRNEPRITLVPDLDGTEKNNHPTYSYGLKGEYEFSVDWFSHKSPAWEAALADFAGKPDVQYLEVGVYEGRSVVWMLENILTHPTSHVTGIDIFYELKDPKYSPEQHQQYERNVIAAGGEGRFTTIVEFSQTALRKLPLDYYDIIYIDGSHFAPSVLEDAILSMRLLKAGGVLIFDDYRWWPTDNRIDTPRYAIDVFIELYGDQFDVLHTEAQVIMVRKQLDNKSKGLDLPADVAADQSEELTL